MIPDSVAHRAAFEGAISNLATWRVWRRDLAHSGAVVADLWKKARRSVQYGCQSEIANLGVDDGSEYMIRQNPDNPCLLESSVDGTHWCTFADISKCQNFGTQPGAGSPQPPPGGGTINDCKTLQANGKLLIPTVVNTGDTIAIKVSGSGNGGSGDPFPLEWYCPDGNEFFGGACVGGAFTQGGDPLPATSHFALIINIGGTFYPIPLTFSAGEFSGSITVPGGVSNQAVNIQVNDASLTDNSGSYQICYTVTNNQATTWTHTVDLTLTPDSWVSGHTSVPPLSDSTWMASQGWKPGGDGSHTRLLLENIFAATNITSVSVTYTVTSNSGSLADSLRAFNGASLVADSGALDLSVGTHTVTLIVGATCTQFQFDIFTSGVDSYAAIAWSASGRGVNPF
jgi:hypothetical protein